MIEKISKTEFVRMVNKYHYSKVLPKLTTCYLGDSELSAVISLGHGVRPLHTIRKLFPSLTTVDYLEIGKMCVADSMPRNTESKFLKRILEYVRLKYPSIKLVFTWADGMLGKVGYVYQASNFLYGQFIWTDTYFTHDGEKIHPRMTGKIGGRPTIEYQKQNGWLHYRGKQFRYIYFLCSHKEQKQLLKESDINWTRNYPKFADLEWRVLDNGKWENTAAPPYRPGMNKFSDNARRTLLLSKQNLLFGDIDAVEVSREIHFDSIEEGAVRFCDTAY